MEKFCNCSCCDCNKICSRLYQRIFNRNENINNANASLIFNREGIIAARPSVTLPYGGKFESIDYDRSENSMFVSEQISKGNRFIFKQYLNRCLLVFLTGFITGFTGAVAESSINVINCYKNSFLSSYLIGDYQQNISQLFLYGLTINLGIAFIGSFVVVFIEPAATGGGISGALGYMNGVNVPKAVAYKVLIVKVVSFICMSAAGLPGGKEGPMIHVGAIVGASLPKMRIPFTNIRIFPNMIVETERRDLSAAGVAAGLAAAFCTPLGAFLISIEEFMSFWSGCLFFEIFMASLVSSITYAFFIKLFFHHYDGTLTVNDLLFLDYLNEEHIRDFSVYQVLFCVVIGVLGSLLGCLWICIHKMMALFRRRFIKFKVLQLLEVLFWTVVVHTVYISLLTGTSYCTEIPEHRFHSEMCTLKPSSLDLKLDCPDGQFATMALFSLKGNHEIFESFLHPKEDLIPLVPQVITFVAYYLMSGFFSGSMISAGLFVPNMISGAAFGRLLSLLLKSFFNQEKILWAPTQVCAFFGSAALLSPVVRLTFSLAVVYCEGASAFILFFPMVVALLTVKIIADLLIDGIYEVQCILAGIPLLSRYPPPVALDLTAYDVMPKVAVVYLTTPTTVRRLIQVSFESRHNGFPIVDTKYTTSRNDNEGGTSVGRLIGLILRSQILVILKNQWFDNPATPQIARQRLLSFQKDLADLLTPRKTDAKAGMNLDANVNLEAYMDPSPFSVKWNSSLNRTYRIFCSLGLRHLIVTNNGNEVVGIITRKDLAKYNTKYNITGIHVHIRSFK